MDKSWGVGDREEDDIGDGERREVEDGSGSEVIIASEAAYNEKSGVPGGIVGILWIVLNVVLDLALFVIALFFVTGKVADIYNFDIVLIIPFEEVLLVVIV